MTVPIPVLAQNIARGEKIHAHHFKNKNLPVEWRKRNIVLAPKEILGKIARQSLQSGAPVYHEKLENPVLVKKKTLVTMTLSSPTLLVSTRGMALENGRMNDTIRIQNTTSKKVIEATVTGIQKVNVPSPL
jgi:flagella basal body P-ring formation protein FlgA